MSQVSCPNCDYDLSPDASFCTNCGETISTSPSDQSQESSDGELSYPPEPDDFAARDVDLDVIISTPRIVALSVISGGLYFFWWMYRSWDLLQEETGEQHFPIWHSLTQLVPMYGLYKILDHVSIIQLLRSHVGTPTALNPSTVVTIQAVIWLLVFMSFGVSPGVSLILIMIGTAMATVIVVWSQQALNEYWRYSRGDEVEEAPIGAGEVLLTILGAVFWIFAIVDL
jgi:hypothetical protein